MAPTFIAQYELNNPPETLWSFEGCSKAYILVRKNSCPIGVLDMPLKSDWVAISRQQVEEALEQYLGIAPAFMPAFPQPPGEPKDVEMPGISVVVCTRDRALSLKRCLKALGKLEYDRFEVVVVDNASREKTTQEAVAATPFRYVREERAGLNWARNRGAAEARYDIIAYTDDDVQVDPKWLQGVARAFASPETAGMTGLVLPGELETPAQHLFQIYSRGMSKGAKAKEFNGKVMSARDKITTHFLGVGANMAFRRGELKRLGGFDTALDVGTPSLGAGDLDMFHRVLASGGTIRYEPSALVWHYDRRTFEGFRKQLYSNGCAFGVYLIKCWRSAYVKRRSVAEYAFGVWAPWLLGRLVLRLMRRHRLPMSLLWAEVWGALHAPWAYVLTNRHDQQMKMAQYP